MAFEELRTGVEVEAADGFSGRIVSDRSHFRWYESFGDGAAVIRVVSVLGASSGEIRRYDARSLKASRDGDARAASRPTAADE